MLELNKEEYTTEEGKSYSIDYWAKLFKATTWEELRMIAKHNPHLEEAAKTIYQMSDDELIRERCRAREEHYRILAGFQNAAKEAQDRLSDAQAALQKKDEIIIEQAEALNNKDAEIERLRAELAALKH